MLCLIGVTGQAQERQPPGMVARLDLTQRLEFSDNPDLDVDGTSDGYGRTLLDFGLESVTPLQAFSLFAGSEIREGRSGRAGLDVTNANFGLNYDRATRNAAIGTALRYREQDVNGSFLSEDFDSNGTLAEQTGGTRTTYGFTLSGAIGMEAPVGASFDLDYSEFTYSGTSDPDLTDRNTLDFAGQIDFRLDSRIEARLSAKYIDFDTEGNGVNRRTTGVGLGFALDVTPTLTADVGIGYDKIERSGDQTGTNEGLDFSAELTRTLTNGTLAASLDSEVSSNADGRRTSFSLAREMELSPRASLAYSLGGTRSASSNIEPLVSFDYSYALPAAEISLGLAQRLNTNDDNQEQINSALTAAYTQQITELSSLSATFSVFDRNELGAQAQDGRRIDISLSYQYAVTRDWGLVGGLSHVLSTSDGEADRSSNTLFIGLSRSFAWSP